MSFWESDLGAPKDGVGWVARGQRGGALTGYLYQLAKASEGNNGQIKTHLAGRTTDFKAFESRNLSWIADSENLIDETPQKPRASCKFRCPSPRRDDADILAWPISSINDAFNMLQYNVYRRAQ